MIQEFATHSSTVLFGARMATVSFATGALVAALIGTASALGFHVHLTQLQNPPVWPPYGLENFRKVECQNRVQAHV